MDCNGSNSIFKKNYVLTRCFTFSCKKQIVKKSNGKQKEKDFSKFYDLLKENTSLMISASQKVPAKLLKSF